MREKPILFSSEMVRAILDGRKTQTRRIIKPQPCVDLERGYSPCGIIDGKFVFRTTLGYSNHFEAIYLKPKYQVGDRLWVRENIKTICYPYRDGKNRYGYGEQLIEYVADGQTEKCPDAQDEWWRHNWHVRSSTTIPSIHMPRWASRITLEVTNIRVERLQDISELDALAEGVDGERLVHGKLNGVEGDFVEGSCREGYKALWNSINTKRGYGWEADPWVWVVEFKRIELTI